MKNAWIPTPLAPARTAPQVAGLEQVDRWRSLTVYATLAGLLARCVGLRLRRERPVTFGRALRTAFTGLGGYWPRIAHLLSIRVDILPIEVCRELSDCAEADLAFPLEDANRVLMMQLGPLDEVFESLEAAPFEARAEGQLYRARLRREAVDVTVKVQRPHVVQRFHADLRCVQVVLRGLQALWPRGLWREMSLELEAVLDRELDYRIEASNMRRLRKQLRPHRIHVPKVYSRYCKERVLVCEFIPGVPMKDFIRTVQHDIAGAVQWLQDNEIEPERVAKTLYLSNCHQIFEQNLFHGSMEPQNLMLLRKGRVVLLDHRSVRRLTGGFQKRYEILLRAFAVRDFSKLTDLLLLLTPALPRTDQRPLRTEMERVLRLWESRANARKLPYHDKSLAGALGQLCHLATRRGVPVNWHLLQVISVYSGLDKSVTYLGPRLNYIQLTKRFWASADEGHLETGMDSRSTLTKVLTMSEWVLEMGDSLHDVAFFHAERLRTRARNFQQKGFGFSQAVGRAFGFAAASLAVLILLVVGLSVAPVRVLEPIRAATLLPELPEVGSFGATLVCIACLVVVQTSLKIRSRLSRQSPHDPASD